MSRLGRAWRRGGGEAQQARGPRARWRRRVGRAASQLRSMCDGFRGRASESRSGATGSPALNVAREALAKTSPPRERATRDDSLAKPDWPPTPRYAMLAAMHLLHIREHSSETGLCRKPGGGFSKTSENVPLHCFDMSVHVTKERGQPFSAHGHGPLSWHGGAAVGGLTLLAGAVTFAAVRIFLTRPAPRWPPYLAGRAADTFLLSVAAGAASSYWTVVACSSAPGSSALNSDMMPGSRSSIVPSGHAASVGHASFGSGLGWRWRCRCRDRTNTNDVEMPTASIVPSRCFMVTPVARGLSRAPAMRSDATV